MMANEIEKSSDNKSERAEEPTTAFKTVQFFQSFEEMEQDELEWLAVLSPEEHLHHAVSLIKRVFSQQLEKHPKIGTDIHFD